MAFKEARPAVLFLAKVPNQRKANPLVALNQKFVHVYGMIVYIYIYL